MHCPDRHQAPPIHPTVAMTALLEETLAGVVAMPRGSLLPSWRPTTR